MRTKEEDEEEKEKEEEEKRKKERKEKSKVGRGRRKKKTYQNGRKKAALSCIKYLTFSGISQRLQIKCRLHNSFPHTFFFSKSAALLERYYIER